VQTAGGLDAPDSQSQHEANLAIQAFGRDAGDVVVLYSSPTLTTASPAFRSAVTWGPSFLGVTHRVGLAAGPGPAMGNPTAT